MPGKLFGKFNVMHQKNTAGGCASCLADAIFGVITPFAPLTKQQM